MPQITLDAALAGKLSAVVQSVELCDPNGKVLGHFVPKFDPAEWEPVTPDISEEELADREKSTDWYTTEQVLEHLRRLENS